MKHRSVTLAVSGIIGFSLLAGAPAAAHHRNVDLDVSVEPATTTLTEPGSISRAGYTISVANTGNVPIRAPRLVVAQPSVTGPGASVVFEAVFPGQGDRCRPGAQTILWPDAAVVCTLPRLRPGDTWEAVASFFSPDFAPALVGEHILFDSSVYIWHGPSGTSAAGATDTSLFRRVRAPQVSSELVKQSDELLRSYVPPTGGIVQTQGDDPFQNTLLGVNNPLMVRVTVPPSDNGIPVTIIEREEDQPREVCPLTKRFCIGQVLEFSVPGEFTSAAPLEVFLRWDSSALPPGKKLKWFAVVWIRDNGKRKWVTQRCDATRSVLPCRDPNLVRFDDGDWGLTIYLPHNGRVRGL